MTIHQKILPISLNDEATFENYLAGPNSIVINYLKSFLKKNNQNNLERYLFLWGDLGTGCSHLLQAGCHFFLENYGSAVYLNFKNQQSLTPAIFDNLEQFDLVCLDDIHAVINKEVWEEALFYFYNRCFEKNNLLIISAKKTPTQLSIRLPDLASRINSGVSLQLQHLTDEEKIQVLKMRAKRRGLLLSDEVCFFFLRRYPRDMKALFDALILLDRASLKKQRKVTIPFIKEVLNL